MVEKRKKKALFITLGSILLVLALILGFLFINYVSPQPKLSDSSLSKTWMSKIEDETPLSEISIPATHDAGAIRKGGIYRLGNDQTLTIANQLKIGVRFFDVRLGIKNDKLTVYHGFLNEKVLFESILSDFQAFLAENPSETILLCVKKETGEDIKSAFHEEISPYESIFYTQNNLPTLGEVRGKIVLFRRYFDETNFGINLYDNFADNATFSLDNGVKCFVQDEYIVPKKENLSDKWAAVESTLNYAAKSEGEEIIINFTSAYIPLITGTPIPRIQVVANYIHPRLKEYLKENPKGQYGIVLVDFITEELSALIYQSNF